MDLWTFSPSGNFSGAVSLSYAVIDGNGGSIAASNSFAVTAAVTVVDSKIGKGKLTGTKKADQFTFDQFESFGVKTADKIIRFNLSQGDTIGVSAEAFPSLQGADEITFATANTKKHLNRLSRQYIDFVYFEKKGRLFFNGNESDKGWVDQNEGGLFAILKGKPELSVEDFSLLA